MVLVALSMTEKPAADGAKGAVSSEPTYKTVTYKTVTYKPVRTSVWYWLSGTSSLFEVVLFSRWCWWR